MSVCTQVHVGRVPFQPLGPLWKGPAVLAEEQHLNVSSNPGFSAESPKTNVSTSCDILQLDFEVPKPLWCLLEGATRLWHLQGNCASTEIRLPRISLLLPVFRQQLAQRHGRNTCRAALPVPTVPSPGHFLVYFFIFGISKKIQAAYYISTKQLLAIKQNNCVFNVCG